MSKDPYPHRERLDNPAGDQVIVPKEFYRLRDRRRPIDRYDTMWFSRINKGDIPERAPKGGKS